jgi:hypothetical protein
MMRVHPPSRAIREVGIHGSREIDSRPMESSKRAAEDRRRTFEVLPTPSRGRTHESTLLLATDQPLLTSAVLIRNAAQREQQRVSPLQIFLPRPQPNWRALLQILIKGRIAHPSFFIGIRGRDRPPHQLPVSKNKPGALFASNILSAPLHQGEFISSFCVDLPAHTIANYLRELPPPISCPTR